MERAAYSLLQASNPNDAPTTEEILCMQKANMEEQLAKVEIHREIAKAEAARDNPQDDKNWHTLEAEAARCTKEAEALLATTKSGSYP